ncbi:sigma-54-dependent Fis family transcriptional regulator [Pseudonocardia lacus]|uniref:sigma-54-dependent Fis family transcriptional regulator n=1 Tax=Pseudonocardia lacus TaxID=2835865 RepID=UPI001BDC2B33|nr:helix-turn-helix domain-containing protein [Pseudonocardia lacus]
MSGDPGARMPRTAVEWDRVRAVKHEVLVRDPLDVDPADFPDVRPEVVASWRRSALAGVDPAATDYRFDDGFHPGTRLAAVAQPIMDRLRDEIADLDSWGFLADRGCRLLTAVVGDFPRADRVHRQNLSPGMCFAEDVMGTNGLGCAHETQRAFVVSGTEHFRTDTEVITTTGVIIRDPVTSRYAGTLGVHCHREYGSAALLPLVVEIGRSIEAQLLASRTDGERELFDAFSTARRRHRDPVVAVSRRLCVVSTGARSLVHEADEEVLRRIAEECGPRPRTLRRTLSSGAVLTIRVLPVPQPRGEFAAVMVLQPVDRPAPEPVPPGRVPATDPIGALREQIAQALDAGRPVLLSGERGSGQRHQARAALRALGHAGGIVELDAALAPLAPDEWLRRLAAALRDPTAPVLLAHVTDLPAGPAATTAALLAGAAAPVVATSRDDTAPDGAAALVRESFPVLLGVAPLRERRAGFAALCAELLADLAQDGDDHVVLTPRAEAALAAGDWPGNVRQLRQVLAGARLRATGPAIDLPDLPAHRRVHPLDEVRAAERRVLMAALRDTGGDRNAVADRLGVSRATVYRKLKRHELR